MKVPTVLTIAGSDTSGGAGIQGDLKTLQALGVYGLSVLTSITAQDTNTVLDVYDLPPEFVCRQIKAVSHDVRINAVKTGMLSNQGIIEAVAYEIKKLGLKNLVVDPVMGTTSGYPLMMPGAQQSLLQKMFPLARVVTPNVPEAEELSKIAVRTIEQMKQAARIIADTGAEAVLVKGGHLSQDLLAVDVLYQGSEFHVFSCERINIPGGVHGTGCAFSSAIAAGLAKGLNLVEAVSQAKTYITGAIRGGYKIGRGQPVLDFAWHP